jgi:peptidoglycan/LPS O-acetylase OafA/YrhL
MNKTVHFPGLNAIRAVAALAVVISHITVSLKEFNLNPYIFGASADGEPQGLLLASHGVSIFFVLSGFLITWLLLAEREIQTISIKKFYLRRILRIWPLYYLFLAVCIIVIISIGTGLNLRSLILYIFYAANVPFVLGMSLPFLGHYWSLGVEGQFYLFWPWLVKNKISTAHYLYPHCCSYINKTGCTRMLPKLNPRILSRH